MLQIEKQEDKEVKYGTYEYFYNKFKGELLGGGRDVVVIDYHSIISVKCHLYGSENEPVQLTIYESQEIFYASRAFWAVFHDLYYDISDGPSLYMQELREARTHD
jgi:hypothetical protein